MLKGQLLTSFVWPIMVMGALCEGNIEDIGDMSGGYMECEKEYRENREYERGNRREGEKEI